MLADYALRMFKLLGSAAFIIAFSYLLSTTDIGKRLLTVKEQTFNNRERWLICLIFGGFAFYNALSITSHGADVRIIGPLLAGFIAGPVVGTGVAVIGIIGALLEYALDLSMSRVHTGDILDSIIVVNLLAGFSAGIFQRSRKRFITGKSAVLFVLAFDLFIMFPAELLLANDPQVFFKTAIMIFPPMLVVHIMCTILFLLLIRNFHNEQTAEAIEKKITIEKDVAQKIFQSLYSFSKNQSTTTDELTLSIFPKTSSTDFTSRFVAQISVNKHFYFVYGHFFGTQIPVAMAISYLKPLFETLAQNHLTPQAIHNELEANLLTFSAQNVRLNALCGQINLRDNSFKYFASKNCQPLVIRNDRAQRIDSGFCLQKSDVIAVLNIETNTLPPPEKIKPPWDNSVSAAQQLITDALYITINQNAKHVAQFTCNLACNTELMNRLFKTCTSFCEEHSLPARAQRDVGLLLDETVSNAIKYSGAADMNDSSAIVVNVAYESESRQLEVTVSWKGAYFDPIAYSAIPEATSRIPGGWGIFLVKKITDTITFERKNDYNTLIMQKTYPEN